MQILTIFFTEKFDKEKKASNFATPYENSRT
jgi:hypothetical protein